MGLWLDARQGLARAEAPRYGSGDLRDAKSSVLEGMSRARTSFLTFWGSGWIQDEGLREQRHPGMAQEAPGTLKVAFWRGCLERYRHS